MFTQLKSDLTERGIISDRNFLVRCVAYAACGFLTVFIGTGHFSSTNNVNETQLAAVITSTYTELSPVGNNDPSLAFGVAGISDYGDNMPYLDLMHYGRAFSGNVTGTHFGSYTNKMLKDKGYLDANGWPKAIPPELSSIYTIWAKTGGFGSTQYRAGTYVVKYEGEGTLEVGLDAKVVSSVPGTLVFTTGGGAFMLSIMSTDPKKIGNYIRNISVVKQENIPLLQAGEIFNPDYIAKIKDARQLRFMDVMGTNASDMVDWSEMPTEDSVTWKPMPIAVQVRLANEVGADPWFNVPFHANDQFIKNFATYVHDHLDPKLVASVEYSNEVWNFSFQQAHDAYDLATTEYGVVGGAGWMNYYGEKAAKVMNIWTGVYGADAKTRLVRVLGAQSGSDNLLTNSLEAPMWKKADPVNYIAPYTSFDAVAITTYFGNQFIQNADLINRVMSQPTPEAQNELHYKLLTAPVTQAGQITFTQNSKIVTTSVPVTSVGGFYIGSTSYGIAKSTNTTSFTLSDNWPNPTVTYNQINYWVNDATLRNVAAKLKTSKAVASAHGLRMVAYEGGQHVHHSAFVKIDATLLDSLQGHLTTFVRSPQMADLYGQLWDIWKGVGEGPFMQFVDIDAPSKYGSWGLYASLNDTNPRAAKLTELNATTPAWWEKRAGQHFQQGLILTAPNVAGMYVGTSQEDYFVGTDADDVFYPGTSDDGVNGGNGKDTVIFKGNQSQYTVTPKGSGYRVVGPEGSDYVYAVEVLKFADGSRILDTTTLPPTVATPKLVLSISPTTMTLSSTTSRNVATLTWASTDATSCAASGDWSGSRLVSGTASTGVIATVGTKTYTLRCLGVGGTVEKSVSVNMIAPVVVIPAPTLMFSVSPVTVVAGGAATLTWTSTDATSCVADGDWSGAKDISGSAPTGALAIVGTKTFILNCTGVSGVVKKSVTIVVAAPAPTLSLSISSTSLASNGGNVTLTWSSANATSCTASGRWIGVKKTSGSEVSGPFTNAGAKTYTLSCVGAGGTVAKTVSVDVTAPTIPKLTFSVSPSVVSLPIIVGSSDGLIHNTAATLTWTSTDATSCMADGDWSGQQAINGSASTGVLTAVGTKNFTLSCTGAGGVVKKTASVEVTGTALNTTDALGYRVVTMGNVTVRSQPKGVNVGGQPKGVGGVVIAKTAALVGDYLWDYINFDTGIDGWVAEQYITKVN